MPYIKQDFIDQLIRDADILDVFQHYGYEAKKKGSNYFSLSPFTDEKSPSCAIYQKTQTFKDYSTGKQGQLLNFIMEYKNFSYLEAVQELASIYKKSIEYEDPQIAEKYQAKQVKEKSLRQYLKALLPKFQEQLHNLPKSHPAWQEIAKRGYTAEDVKAWEIGFAPGSQFMYRLFSDAGNVEAGKNLGLINDNDQDKLMNRLVYPIRDKAGNISGFASRRLGDDEKFAKWMNPAENPLYDKSRSFYGMNFAWNTISKQNRAWIVEGYNDAIAWHLCGLENTVGICGTAFTVMQMKELKKITSKITLCLDGDKAGQSKIPDYIKTLLSLGFSVDVCTLPDGLDPDDFSRKVRAENEEVNLEVILKPYISEGFDVLLKEKLQGDVLDIANGAKEIVEVISKVPDATMRELYLDKLTKASKLKPAIIRNLFKEMHSENIRVENSQSENYPFPSFITTKAEVLEPIVDKYEMFISDDMIFMYDPANNHFTKVSNFSVDILQHMNDEKFPKKLLRICNSAGEERIFDTAANTLNAPQRFKDELTNQGNFRWEGNQKDLDKLAAYLYDKMGIGRKVDVLGWNPEGFHCWNNFVTVPGDKSVEIDKNGIFHFDGHTYYVPSANEIYRQNPNRFAQQKKVRLIPAGFPMDSFLAQMKAVHREFGIIGMLFAFASAHQDVIVEAAKGFPIYFLYGPPSTGKDELYGIIKKMFGIAKTDFMNLENRQTTGKAKLRSLGEFSNMVVHYSEYINGDKEIDGMLKGIWDRGSYKRATLDSAVSTDSTAILSAAIVTGNQSPTDEAVLTRLIYGEMTKNQFTTDERQNFEKLENMTTDGLTSYMDKVIWQRPAFVEKFPQRFNEFKKILSKREAFKGAIDRIITNYAILGATYRILSDSREIIFPFEQEEMLTIFDDFVKNLRTKLDSANILSRFWDVFVACLYGNETTKLHINIQLDVDGTFLIIRWTEVYNRIQTEWFSRFGETAPAKNTLSEKLKQSKAFIRMKDAHYYSKSVTSSGFEIDLNKIENKESIMTALKIQQDDLDTKETGMQSLYPNPPATPFSESGKGDIIDELGF